MSSLVYFSSASENTHRFMEKLGLPAQRIPLTPGEPPLRVSEPYVLVLPTYGSGKEGGAVPRQVVKFLNDASNRALIRGVIAAGNTNFGETYLLAGHIIAAKCSVPFLYGFELMGTREDVIRVREGLGQFWQSQRQIPA
jgi:protein involved in ribonucleotide reduction